MASNIQASSSSTPNFQPIFEKALEKYKKKTGEDLTTHPLAAEIKAGDSPDAILTVLERRADELNETRSGDDRLTKWLSPTVNILNALSATLGEGAGSVFPPTKIIFSGIGILLVAAKSTVASRDVLAELFDRIESFFRRLKTYTEVPLTQAVIDVLAKIMAEVLSILAIATKGVKEKRTKTILKKLAGMNDIEDALQKLRKLEQGELLTVIAQVSRDTSGIKDDAKETKGMVKEIIQKMDTRKWEEVLQKLKEWLTPPDPSTNYNIGLRDLHKETTSWFVEGSIIQEWCSTGSLLWIHGKPGAGKSTLCSAIIRRIISLSDGGRIPVAYFYFDFRDDNKKHSHNLLRSLLFQFATHSIPCCETVLPVYSAHGKGTQQPSDDVLIDCLTNILLATTKQPIYIIVDVLDESPDTPGVPSPRELVLGLINDLVNLRLPNLHICVTSRPEIDIRIRLESLASLRVSLHDQTGQKEDITKYIRFKVDVIANVKGWRKDDKNLVIETLSETADGMFRWVYCQLEMLRHCLPSKIRQSVNKLPKTLDETYKRILEEIPEMNQDHVLRLLQCLAVAIRPLRVEELAEILAFDWDGSKGEVPTFNADWRSKDQERELLSACPSLITVVGRHGWRVVQFSHFSVKEFLTSDRLATSKDISHYHILPDAAHATLARASLGVLLHLGGHINAQAMPLAEYAAEHWVSHAQVGSVSSHVTRTMETLFDSDKPHFEAWVQTYNIDRRTLLFRVRETPKPRPRPLYYSALCGFYDLVEHLVKKHPQEVNILGGVHGFPLVVALQAQHTRVAEFLLQHGANVDVRGLAEETPLHTVIQWPNNLAVGAVHFLLEHGADVNAREKSLSTPLHLAATKGRFEVAQLLLERGGDVNARGKDDETPLHLASGNLDFESMRSLLDHGADVNATDNWGRTPLFRLWDRGKDSKAQSQFDFVQLLMERGADVNARDVNDETPLHLVSGNLEFRSMRSLLDHGADVNATDNWGRTPLFRLWDRGKDSKAQGQFDFVQLLMERGADVNARDVNDETPLHLASGHLKFRSMRSLLDHGADVNATDNQGRTPLFRLWEWENYSEAQSRFDFVQLLMERGVAVNAQDKDGETPLHLASFFLDLESVRLLLDRGAGVHAVDNFGQTPLHFVVIRGCARDKTFFGAIQLLMERGADVNARDEGDGTPLHLASGYLELKSMRSLLDYGADVNAADNQGQTPLFWLWVQEDGRKGQSRFDFVQLLMERGAAVNARNKKGETPLHFASSLLDLESVRLLLDCGAGVKAANLSGRTPLHRVLENKHAYDEDIFDVMQLLTERGADVNAPDNNHETPLHLASRVVLLEAAWLLLRHSADLNAKNKEGKTPFQLARESIRRGMKQSPPSRYFTGRRPWQAQCVVLMVLLDGY